MQLNITTDYAIRTVLFLGQNQEKASASQISEAVNIPQGYLEKVLTKLKKASYISADIGVRGGYYLNKCLEEIMLGDLIKVMENTVKINRCLEADHYCSMGGVGTCKVHQFYTKVQEKLEDHIFNISLKKILDEKENIQKDCEVSKNENTV